MLKTTIQLTKGTCLPPNIPGNKFSSSINQLPGLQNSLPFSPSGFGAYHQLLEELVVLILNGGQSDLMQILNIAQAS